MTNYLVLETRSVSKRDIITVLVGRTIAEVERELIVHTLEHCGGNKARAARMLGISVRTLRNKLARFAEDDLSNSKE